MRTATKSRIGCTVAMLLSLLTPATRSAAQDQTRASAPQATETWVCTDRTWSPREGRPPLELSLEGNLVIEQPLGATRYRLIANTQYALIAVDDFADFDPVLGQVSIFASTLVLDRTTGAFAITTTTLSETPPGHRAGRCRVFDNRPAADRALAQTRP
jgi:hypothetical protein